MPGIFKFGGALMKNAEDIRRIAAIIRPYVHQPMIVVVSAIGKTTNALEHILQLAFDKNKKEMHRALLSLEEQHMQLCRQLSIEDQKLNRLSTLFGQLENELHTLPGDRYEAYDRIVGFGEQFASHILLEFFQSVGLPVVHTDARQIIVTDDNHTTAAINWEKTESRVKKTVSPLFSEGKFILTEGFIGADETGKPTTLGREGSDFTAAILAYVLDAGEVTIWKDVPGLMSADPNRFKESVKLDQISYHEAVELAFYGASVIHPKTIQPLQKKNIPLLVRSFYQPDADPSFISGNSRMDDKVPKVIVKDNQALLSIQSKDLSFIAEEHLTTIFAIFNRYKVHINLMQHSAVSFSVCFDDHPEKLNMVLNDLKNEFTIRYNSGIQLFTVRHYTEEIVQNILKGRQVLLEQKSRTVMQALVK